MYVGFEHLMGRYQFTPLCPLPMLLFLLKDTTQIFIPSATPAPHSPTASGKADSSPGSKVTSTFPSLATTSAHLIGSQGDYQECPLEQHDGSPALSAGCTKSLPENRGTTFQMKHNLKRQSLSRISMASSSFSVNQCQTFPSSPFSASWSQNKSHLQRLTSWIWLLCYLYT